jgi:hypothetical protein
MGFKGKKGAKTETIPTVTTRFETNRTDENLASNRTGNRKKNVVSRFKR